MAIRQRALSTTNPGGPDQATARAANQLAAGAMQELRGRATPSVPSINRDPVELPPALANMLRDKPAPPPAFVRDQADLNSLLAVLDAVLGSEAPKAETEPI